MEQKDRSDHKGLEKRKTYYVKVCAYKVDSQKNKVFGSYRCEKSKDQEIKQSGKWLPEKVDSHFLNFMKNRGGGLDSVVKSDKMIYKVTTQEGT